MFSVINDTNGSLANGSFHVPPYWKPVPTVLLSGTMICFMTFAIIGNIMVISVVVRHKGMRTRTNMFLCSLAVADLLTAVLLMPVALVTVIQGRWIFNEIFCQINGFLMPLFFVASIHTLMYISVHKCVTIMRPFTRCMSRRCILCMIGAAWFWALVSGYVSVHGLNYILYKPATTQCGPNYPHDARTKLHPIYMTLTCYLLPFVVMAVCYFCIFREMRAHSSRMQATSNLEKDMLFRQQQRITVTLIVVMAVFVISWTPYIMYSFYVSALKDKDSVPANLNAICYWFGYMNSACNPIIYALRSKAFRDGYKELWCSTQNLIVSEATESPYQSNALHRLQAFIQNSMGLHMSSSNNSVSASNTLYPGTTSRKASVGSHTQFTIHTSNRKPSTLSLPECFRYATASLPRSSNIQKHTSFAMRDSAVYSPDSYKTFSHIEVLQKVDVNGAVKVDQNGKVDEIFNDVKLNNLEYNDDSIKVMLEDEEDNVFVVVADVEKDKDNICETERTILTPLIQVKELENINGKDGTCMVETVQAEPLPNRSSSEANISTQADTAAVSSSTGLLRAFLKTLQNRSRDGLHSATSSIRSRLSSARGEDTAVVQVSQTTRFPKRKSLTVPHWRTLLRSVSDDPKGHGVAGDSSCVTGIHKVASDSRVFDSHTKEQARQLWPKTENNKNLDEFQFKEDERERLQRTWSAKPQMLRSLSVEKLDAESHRRTWSFIPSHKRKRKPSHKSPLKENSRQKLILFTKETQLEDIDFRKGTEKKGRFVQPGQRIFRSWSDPCMNIERLQQKLLLHQRKQKH